METFILGLREDANEQQNDPIYSKYRREMERQIEEYRMSLIEEATLL